MDSHAPVVLAVYPRFARLFGACFALMGIIGVVCSLNGNGTVEFNNGSSRPVTPADSWLPGIIVLIGLGIMGVRYRQWIEPDRRMLIKIWGWGLWVRRREESIADWEQIEMGPAEERGSGSGRMTAVPVRAISAKGRSELAAPKTSVLARQLAIAIANALGIPLADHLGGIKPSASASVGERSPEPVAPRQAGVPPLGTAVRVDEALRGIRITVPGGQQARGLAWLSMGVPMVFVGLFWWFFWRPALAQMPSISAITAIFLYAPLIMAFVGSMVAALAMRRRGMFGAVIEVDRSLGVLCRGRWVSPAEIVAIEIDSSRPPRCAIKLMTTRQERWLVSGQRRNDAEWIRALIVERIGR